MGIEIVQVAEWAHLTWLRHGFSMRVGGHSTLYGGGQLNLGFTAQDSREDVAANRADFLEAVGATDALATVRQVHGPTVLRVTAPGSAGEADALISDRQGLMLAVLTADCMPMLLVDPELRAVAAVHAGWRGTAAGIAGAAVQAMQDQFGSEPGDLLAAIGPSIGPCCYQVGAELHEHFAPDLFTGADHLDLWQANRRQLLAAGLDSAQVTLLAECTSCSRDAAGARRYFSHRAEHGDTGRSMAVIGVV